ncbi:MAG: hypothetical protein ACRDAM_11390, partial [Casimicrobium sp.]
PPGSLAGGRAPPQLLGKAASSGGYRATAKHAYGAGRAGGLASSWRETYRALTAASTALE